MVSLSMLLRELDLFVTVVLIGYEMKGYHFRGSCENLALTILYPLLGLKGIRKKSCLTRVSFMNPPLSGEKLSCAIEYLSYVSAAAYPAYHSWSLLVYPFCMQATERQGEI